MPLNGLTSAFIGTLGTLGCLVLINFASKWVRPRVESKQAAVNRALAKSLSSSGRTDSENQLLCKAWVLAMYEELGDKEKRTLAWKDFWGGLEKLLRCVPQTVSRL
jgi:hypothetical protein